MVVFSTAWVREVLYNKYLILRWAINSDVDGVSNHGFLEGWQPLDCLKIYGYFFSLNY